MPPKPRESPKRAAKDKANQRLSAMQPPPIPVATVVDEAPGNFERSPTDGPFMAPRGDSISRRLDSFESSEDDDNLSIPSTTRVAGAKTTGFDDKSDDDDDYVDPPESPLISPTADHDPPTPTDNEVSRYSFVDRLKHYLEGNKINEVNRASVELCIFVEAGAAVRGMDPMKKEKKESVFFQRYMSILDEIDDDMFVHENIRVNMRIKYKNAKKENSGQSLWRKYETELTEIRNFAKKIPGVGSLSELPSGSNQLRHMKMPLVEALWKEKNPVV